MSKKRSRFQRAVLCVPMSSVLLAQGAMSAPLVLSTAPVGTNYKLPAPNVIVSVDDSGSMAGTGIAALRNSLLNTFTEANVPDGSIRLAWQSMNDCPQIPTSKGSCNNLNGMRVLDATHRARFNAWAGALTTTGSTPSHGMLMNAGEYYRKTNLGVNSPWASVPGVTEQPVLSCRKAYDIFMTDGGWNQSLNILTDLQSTIANADGTNRTLPDGTDYNASSSYPYADPYGSANASTATKFSSNTAVNANALPTLADVAFYYWATDLQPGIANKVPARIAQSRDETFVSGTKSRTVSPYWNPRNDPATWQHMVTYAVGFSTAANWNGVATPTFGADTWTGGDYASLMTGAVGWPDVINIGTANVSNLAAENAKRPPELWHMALNSRGKYVPAPDANALTAAFRDIMETIKADQPAPVTSLALSAANLRTDAASFEAGYNAAGWSGQVIAHKVDAASASVNSEGLWGTVPANGGAPAQPASTATIMDAKTDAWTAGGASGRVVLSSQPSNDGTTATGTVFGTLSQSQTDALNRLNGAVDGRAADRVAFLRGNRGKEANQPAGVFRSRTSRHGDIVNSRLWYLPGKPFAGYVKDNYGAFRTNNASRASMVYVGANDGMLHGFDAASGEEKIAYVPQGVYGRLSLLTSPAYSHMYYVDGSPFTGDMYDGSQWRTYLAGFLGAGGKGYFVLDVTDPSTFSEANAASIVKLDKTTGATDGAADADIGHIFSEPALEQSDPRLTQQITKLNDGRWALVVGNGYNSASEDAVLLIQYLDGSRELVKIAVHSAGGNGLAAPRLIDLDGDRVPDIAYAGDLKGQLWKFDLSSRSADGWKVAFDGTPLFVARNSSGQAQPITSAPVSVAHPNGGVMLVIGTGRNITDADRADTARQSIYGLYDNTVVQRGGPDDSSHTLLSGGSAIAGGRGSLVAQTISESSTASTTEGQPLWMVSSNAVAYSGENAKRGWYIDLPVSGERVVDNLAWFDGKLVSVTSTIPAVGGDPSVETCDPPSSNSQTYTTTINAVNGNAPKDTVYAVETGGTITGDGIPSRAKGGGPAEKLIIGKADGAGAPMECITVAGKICTDMRKSARMGAFNPAWYQLQ